MGTQTKTQTYKVDWIAIIVSIVILAALVVGTIASPETIVSGLDSVKHFLIYNFGFYFILFTAAMLFYNIYLAASKYGYVRLGRSKPEYSFFGWFAMIFCAAMGCTILFWSGCEWAYYTVWLTPFGMNPEETSEIAVAYSFFHWGIPAWSIYATGVIPIAYRYFVRKQPGLTLQGGCEGVLGKHAFGPLGTVISIIFVFGVLGGYAISYGTGIPMLSELVHQITGLPITFLMDLIMIIAVTALFMWSACSGIAKGIQTLSKLCIYLSLALVLLFLVLGHTGFIVNSSIESFGLMLQNFFHMLFYTDPRGFSGFPQEWTVFYWAWWLGLAPVMWIFIAKCSKGRSIRSVIFTVILAGSAASWLYFGTISNQGFGEVVLGGFDWSNLGGNGTMLDIFANDFYESGLIYSVINSLPGGKFVMILWFATAFILFVTTMDSASYTMAAACTKGLAVDDDPKRPFRILFACLLSVTPLCLLAANATVAGFKATLIITSVPISLTIILCLISCHKWLTQDFGSWTREEIERYFAVNEEDEGEVLPEASKEQEAAAPVDDKEGAVSQI